jgi:hypothetical protein
MTGENEWGPARAVARTRAPDERCDGGSNSPLALGSAGAQVVLTRTFGPWSAAIAPAERIAQVRLLAALAAARRYRSGGPTQNGGAAP